MLRIEPRAAGWEAQTLPLCYASPSTTNDYLSLKLQTKNYQNFCFELQMMIRFNLKEFRDIFSRVWGCQPSFWSWSAVKETNNLAENLKVRSKTHSVGLKKFLESMIGWVQGYKICGCTWFDTSVAQKPGNQKVGVWISLFSILSFSFLMSLHFKERAIQRVKKWETEWERQWETMREQE